MRAGERMKVEMKTSILGVALLLCMAGAGAQVFKWVDEKGVVHYSDTPPPPSQKKVELKSFSGGGAGADLPFELAEAVRNFPVTLYTTSQCGACDQGRGLLQARGIPFSEKTVSTNDDQKKLSEAGSAGQLPLLVVGSNKLIGFESGAWNQALSDAAYPAERVLPANYQYAKAESAAPPRAPAPDPQAQARAAARAAAEAEAEAARRRKQAPPSDTPPNFQF
jgi:glutaredoxin